MTPPLQYMTHDSKSLKWTSQHWKKLIINLSAVGALIFGNRPAPFKRLQKIWIAARDGNSLNFWIPIWRIESRVFDEKPNYLRLKTDGLKSRSLNYNNRNQEKADLKSTFPSKQNISANRYYNAIQSFQLQPICNFINRRLFWSWTFFFKIGLINDSALIISWVFYVFINLPD